MKTSIRDLVRREVGPNVARGPVHNPFPSERWNWQHWVHAALLAHLRYRVTGVWVDWTGR